MTVRGKKTKTPPVFSHEFVIQNHADIVAVVAMIIILGLMVEMLNPIASAFIMMQHNITLADPTDSPTLYYAGRKDLLAVFFYVLIMIIGHAVVQEFLLDKVNKKLHLSKVKFAKFNESGQLSVFYLTAFGFAAHLIMEEGYLANINSLWVGYPEHHALMPWTVKLFFILQLSYWIHVFPELYLQKSKKEDMPPKIQLAVLYLVFILSGYCMSFTRVMLVLLLLHYLVEGIFHVAKLMYFLEKTEVASGLFTLWSVLFVAARLASVSISVLTFWFGLKGVHAENSSFGTSLVIRMTALSGMAALQAWMTWNFITFYMKKRRERAELEAASKKVQQPSKKNVKKEYNGMAKKKH